MPQYRARSPDGGVRLFRRASSHCFLDDGEGSRDFATRTLAYGGAVQDARANVCIARCCAATSGITNFSRLPAAQSFAALNLNTLHFTSIDQAVRSANMSDPRTDHGQKLGNGSAPVRRTDHSPVRARSPSPSRAAALDNEVACPYLRALIKRQTRELSCCGVLFCPLTVLLLLRVRTASASGVGTKQGPGRQRVERTPELEDRGERYRRDIAPARHLTGR